MCFGVLYRKMILWGIHKFVDFIVISSRRDVKSVSPLPMEIECQSNLHQVFLLGFFEKSIFAFYHASSWRRVVRNSVS